MDADEFGLIVLGSGPGAREAVREASRRGVRVAWVDHEAEAALPDRAQGERFGRAMAQVATLLQRARRLEGLEGLALPSVIAWASLQALLARLGVWPPPVAELEAPGERLLGASLVWQEPTTLRLGERLLRAPALLLAGATAPLVPAIEGLQPDGYLTPDNLPQRLERLPRRLVVVGGSPVASELAQTFARLGTRVVLVEPFSGLLPQEEPDAAALLEQALRDAGVDIRFASKPVAVRHAEGERVLAISGLDGERAALPYDTLLIACGRVPGALARQPESGGLVRDARGFITVDETFRTSLPGVYALGEQIGHVSATQALLVQAQRAVAHAIQPGAARFHSSLLPLVVFTDPPLASVGRKEAELVATQTPYRVHQAPLMPPPGALGGSPGLVRLLASPEGHLLGATVVGEPAAELIQELALALQEDLPLASLGELLRAESSWSGAIAQAAQQAEPAPVPGWRAWWHRLRVRFR
ncbi:MAG: FAD-dependent oxidoreductase [Candidatus Sericytochromatia bacterium]|nr:FAD-dependent oxidoreductase [Candidatus Sericytochromatia bacterium]